MQNIASGVGNSAVNAATPTKTVGTLNDMSSDLVALNGAVARIRAIGDNLWGSVPREVAGAKAPGTEPEKFNLEVVARRLNSLVRELHEELDRF